MLWLPQSWLCCRLYSLCGWEQLKFGMDSDVCHLFCPYLIVWSVCEYNTSFCTWCILVLDRRVGSPLTMTRLRAVGRKLDLPPFLWNLSSSSLVSSHPLFSHCDNCVLVMFQPPHCCFLASSLSFDWLVLRFWLAGQLADCFSLLSWWTNLLPPSGIQCPANTTCVHLFNHPLYMSSPAFEFVLFLCRWHLRFILSSLVTPPKLASFALHFYGCSFWPAGDSTNLWLQGVLSLFFVSPVAYLKMEECVICVGGGGRVGVCWLKCVLVRLHIWILILISQNLDEGTHDFALLLNVALPVLLISNQNPTYQKE